LQSEENKALSFLILDPLLTYPDFSLTLGKGDLPDLNLEDGDEHKVYVIATVPEDPTKITLNLQGPLVFNMTKKLVQQVVVEGQDIQAPLLKKTES
jgi:flagellar assembly factor FliW